MAQKEDINTPFWLSHLEMEIVEIEFCDKLGMVVKSIWETGNRNRNELL